MANCQKCGEVSERHTFPGGGLAVCPERLGVGFYSTTEAFRAIHQHVAVMRPDLSLVAVCGPSTGPGAMEAIALAQRFAVTDELLALARESFELLNEKSNTRQKWTSTDQRRFDALKSVIARAEGTR